MDRKDLPELHYIAAIENLPSIQKLGILSHAGAARLPHRDLSDPDVQRRRAAVIPGAGKLHDYVNLYLCARNPMLFRRREEGRVCVLAVNPAVLDAPGAIIADGNAASGYTSFRPSPDGLAALDRDQIFAEYWTDPDLITYWRKKSAKCAELLVPDRVPPALVVRVYVGDDINRAEADRLSLGWPVTVDRHLFFR